MSAYTYNTPSHQVSSRMHFRKVKPKRLSAGDRFSLLLYVIFYSFRSKPFSYKNKTYHIVYAKFQILSRVTTSQLLVNNASASPQGHEILLHIPSGNEYQNRYFLVLYTKKLIVRLHILVETDSSLLIRGK